ncbi:hypothetical protein FB567DRAFT_626907 [Paraphoma chrysanthemicola]|uniref:Uncharacterized protein n=1 Tax=Paraphoma chrysanthemicola TaxID=798071 RepID=A0A8K0RCA1_9PLEO|nr:hypothetical protein FB567DRAFT_626907 [Paraphoma chrysanthemicola]
MAEALAIVGTIGAVCNIVDVITKTTVLIEDIRSRWKQADLALLSLASQLTALRAALTEIQRWLERNTNGIHHQLTMDLDVSLSCCRLLMLELETYFSQLNTNDNLQLSVSEKMKFVLRGQGATDIQKHIEHQTNSLALLLTACNCTSLADQKELLERPKTRETFALTQSDSSSLLVLRDSASFVSKWTDNLSRLSRVFDFDTEVLASRAYGRVFRESLKHLIKKRSTSCSTPMQHILLLGHNDTPKIEVETFILTKLQAQPSWEAKLLEFTSPELQVSCVQLTLAVVKRLYGSEKSFRTRQMKYLLNSTSSLFRTYRLHYLLHTITMFWYHASFKTLMQEQRETFWADPGLKEAYEFITSQLFQKKDHMAPPLFDGTYQASSTPTLDRMSFTCIKHNKLTTNLYTSWDADDSAISHFNDRVVPLTMFYVFDLEAAAISTRLEKLLTLLETLQSPQPIPLGIILTSSRNLHSMVAEIVGRIRQCTSLSVEVCENWAADRLGLGKFVADVIRQATVRRNAPERESAGRTHTLDEVVYGT